MAFAEDLSPFFDVAAGFAVQATLNGSAVQGIFDGPADRVDLGYGAITAAPRSRFTLSAGQAGAAPVGQSLVIASGPGAGAWLVAEHEPDGTGMSLLILERA